MDSKGNCSFHEKRGIAILCLLALLFGLFLGCVSSPKDTQPSEASQPINQAERDRNLDQSLSPLIEMVKAKVGKSKVGVPQFYYEGTHREPRMAQYVVPRIESALVNAGVVLIERRNLYQLIQERDLQNLESLDSIRPLSIEGVDFLLTGKVKELSLNFYQIQTRLLNVHTGEIVFALPCNISKTDLPLQYGGK